MSLEYKEISNNSSSLAAWRKTVVDMLSRQGGFVFAYYHGVLVKLTLEERYLWMRFVNRQEAHGGPTGIQVGGIMSRLPHGIMLLDEEIARLKIFKQEDDLKQQQFVVDVREALVREPQEHLLLPLPVSGAVLLKQMQEQPFPTGEWTPLRWTHTRLQRQEGWEVINDGNLARVTFSVTKTGYYEIVAYVVFAPGTCEYGALSLRNDTEEFAQAGQSTVSNEPTKVRIQQKIFFKKDTQFNAAVFHNANTPLETYVSDEKKTGFTARSLPNAHW